MKRKIVIFFIISLLMSCDMFTGKYEELDVQGHRGWRGKFPENTLIGFLQAAQLGVNTLELDVVISKDSSVVVSHEPYMNSEIALTPEGKSFNLNEERKYNLYKMSYEEISKFDCGLKFHNRFPNQIKLSANKPLLSSVFDVIKNSGFSDIKYNIEIKSYPNNNDFEYHPNRNLFVDLVMKEIYKHEMIDFVTIQSFDVETLQVLQKNYSEVSISLLVENHESILEKINKLGFKPDIISPNYELLNKDLVAEVHAQNILVIPWTVNDPNDIKEVLGMDVDGIISDYPDVVLDIIR